MPAVNAEQCRNSEIILIISVSLTSPPFSGTFKVNNVVPAAEGESSKIKVKVRMNIHGVFTIKQASLVEKVQVQVRLTTRSGNRALGDLRIIVFS